MYVWCAPVTRHSAGSSGTAPYVATNFSFRSVASWSYLSGSSTRCRPTSVGTATDDPRLLTCGAVRRSAMSASAAGATGKVKSKWWASQSRQRLTGGSRGHGTGDVSRRPDINRPGEDGRASSLSSPGSDAASSPAAPVAAVAAAPPAVGATRRAAHQLRTRATMLVNHLKT